MDDTHEREQERKEARAECTARAAGLERYRNTMQKVTLLMRDHLTDEEQGDLQLARECGGEWLAGRLRTALAAAEALKDPEEPWDGD